MSQGKEFRLDKCTEVKGGERLGNVCEALLVGRHGVVGFVELEGRSNEKNCEPMK